MMIYLDFTYLPDNKIATTLNIGLRVNNSELKSKSCGLHS